MSATNATSNYSLPLFIGTDKPAWLVDFNGAMTAIDAQMKVNATAIGANETAISGLSTTVSAHTTSINTISGQITTLSTGLNTAQGNINTINSLIGNGEPTTTDKTLIGAINEIYGMITGGGSTEIQAANVSYDGTTSGLLATSVQGAIDELAAAGPGSVDADDVAYDNTDSGLSATNVQDAIDEVAAASADIGNVFGTAVDLASGHATLAELYTAPSNGFLHVVATGTYNCTALIASSDISDLSDTTKRVTIVAPANSSAAAVTFVPKGAKLGTFADMSSAGVVKFYPLS